MKLICTLSFVVALCSIFGSVVGQDIELVNRHVYTIQSKADFGFLTAIGKSRLVDSDIWRDAASQKWKVVKGFFGLSYMLQPTSEEKQSMNAYGHEVTKDHSGFGFSSSQYWTMSVAEKGFYHIRNSKTEECLESGGIGKRVWTSKCRNVVTQQWSVHRR